MCDEVGNDKVRSSRKTVKRLVKQYFVIFNISINPRIPLKTVKWKCRLRKYYIFYTYTLYFYLAQVLTWHFFSLYKEMHKTWFLLARKTRLGNTKCQVIKDKTTWGKYIKKISCRYITEEFTTQLRSYHIFFILSFILYFTN